MRPRFWLGTGLALGLAWPSRWRPSGRDTTRIMERGWFPRTAPPAGGLRAVPDPGLVRPTLKQLRRAPRHAPAPRASFPPPPRPHGILPCGLFHAPRIRLLTAGR